MNKATSLSHGKKQKSTMKLWGVKTLLDGKEKNEYNEALWCHSIVVWEEIE